MTSDRHAIKRGSAHCRRPRRIPIISDLSFFGKIDFREIVQWDLGSVGVSNGWEMAVGFKWTDSQPISNLMGAFSMIFMISIILLSFPMV